VVAAVDFVFQVGIKTFHFSTVVVGVYREDWQA
jgi:GH24 family phage-related lysozyme (muramidase)